MTRLRALVRTTLTRGSLLGHVTTLAGGTAIAQLVAIASLPLVTRLFSPNEIGLFSIYSAFLMFVIPQLSLRYEVAVVLADKEEDVASLFYLCAGLVPVVAFCGTATLSALVALKVGSFADIPVYAISLGPLILIGFGWFNVARAWCLRIGSTSLIARATVWRAFVQSIVRIGTGGLGLGFGGLVLAEICWGWSALIAVFRAVPVRLVQWTKRSRVPGILEVARRFRKFAVFEVPASLLDNTNLMLPVVAAGSLYGLDAAGWFGIAYRVAALPNAQVGRALADTYQMRFGESLRKGRYAEGTMLFGKIARGLAVFGLIPLIGMCSVAPFAFGKVFGETWSTAGWVVALIMPWLYMNLIYSPLSRTFSLIARQELKLICDAVTTILLLSSISVAHYFGFPFLGFVAAISAAMVLAHALYIWLLRRVLYLADRASTAYY